MKKTTVAFTVTAGLLLGVAPSEAGSSKRTVRSLAETPFYAPEVIYEMRAAELAVTEQQAASLPEVLPFWVDLVDKELVPEDGEGVYVAVLDTGVLPWAPFFFSQANVAYGLGIGFTHDVYWDPVLGDIVFGPLRDDRGILTDLESGHGTHVTSTIVGFNVNNSFWVSGVAPKATIIPVLVLDGWLVQTPDGLVGIAGGTDEMVAAGIRYVADLASALDGPVVINMSLGGPDPSPMIEEAVNEAIDQGVTVVVAAGNEGPDGMGWPGAYPQVISAGAGGWADMFNWGWAADVPERLKTRDSLGNHWQIYLEDFSSRPNKDLGQKHKDLDVTAPGAWIVGPYKPAFTSDVGYYYVSGTSMAAPHVSAIASLVLQTDPTVVQEPMETILRGAARGLPLPASDAVVAFPLIEEGWYSASWDGGDWGTGFLQADAAVVEAAKQLK